MSASSTIRIGIVGVGKIVRDQHLPALAEQSRLPARRHRQPQRQRRRRRQLPDHRGNARRVAELDAVSLCMPPQYRYRAARAALEAGKHVFLEKPPGATVSEVEDLKALAARQRRLAVRELAFALRAGCRGGADAFLASARPTAVAINWKEDVRRWHPNQEWIWQAGGLGVFDPGINALSIATHILPKALFVTAATLEFPGKPRRADRRADRLQRCRRAGGDGRLRLAPDRAAKLGHRRRDRRRADGPVGGGAKLAVGGRIVHEEPEAEYPMLYKRFAEIVRAGTSDVDLAPLRHVADAFMLGRHVRGAVLRLRRSRLIAGSPG